MAEDGTTNVSSLPVADELDPAPRVAVDQAVDILDEAGVFLPASDEVTDLDDAGVLGDGAAFDIDPELGQHVAENPTVATDVTDDHDTGEPA